MPLIKVPLQLSCSPFSCWKPSLGSSPYLPDPTFQTWREQTSQLEHVLPCISKPLKETALLHEQPACGVMCTRALQALKFFSRWRRIVSFPAGIFRLCNYCSCTQNDVKCFVDKRQKETVFALHIFAFPCNALQLSCSAVAEHTQTLERCWGNVVSLPWVTGW